jgi:hypothetical protein
VEVVGRCETSYTERTGPGRHEDPEDGLGRTKRVEMDAEATHAGFENRKLDVGRLRRLAVHDELPTARAPAVLEKVEEGKTPDLEKTIGGEEGEGEAANTVEVAAEARRSAAARRCRRMVVADDKVREGDEKSREAEDVAGTGRSSGRRPAHTVVDDLAAALECSELVLAGAGSATTRRRVAEGGRGQRKWSEREGRGSRDILGHCRRRSDPARLARTPAHTPSRLPAPIVDPSPWKAQRTANSSRQRWRERD